MFWFLKCFTHATSEKYSEPWHQNEHGRSSYLGINIRYWETKLHIFYNSNDLITWPRKNGIWFSIVDLIGLIYFEHFGKNIEFCLNPKELFCWCDITSGICQKWYCTFGVVAAFWQCFWSPHGMAAGTKWKARRRKRTVFFKLLLRDLPGALLCVPQKQDECLPENQPFLCFWDFPTIAIYVTPALVFQEPGEDGLMFTGFG